MCCWPNGKEATQDHLSSAKHRNNLQWAVPMQVPPAICGPPAPPGPQPPAPPPPPPPLPRHCGPQQPAAASAAAAAWEPPPLPPVATYYAAAWEPPQPPPAAAWGPWQQLQPQAGAEGQPPHDAGAGGPLPPGTLVATAQAAEAGAATATACAAADVPVAQTQTATAAAADGEAPVTQRQLQTLEGRMDALGQAIEGLTDLLAQFQLQLRMDTQHQ